MALLKGEAKEWRSLQGKQKRHHIAVERVGPANVVFLPVRRSVVKSTLN
jgi:hypothetical protein